MARGGGGEGGKAPSRGLWRGVVGGREGLSEFHSPWEKILSC